MQIENDWELDDRVTGLKLKVVEGAGLDHLRIESETFKRDYWFAKDGEFDGTSSPKDSS